MSITSELEKAQGGQLYRKLGEIAGLSAADARQIMEGLCPSIAARLKERASDRTAYEALLELLEDNEGDLIMGGDLTEEDVLEDGRTVLADIYGSDERARDEGKATALALRIEPGAAEQLHPIAAALVLSILGRRYREGEVVEDEAKSRDSTGDREAEGRPNIIGIVLAAIGGAIMRALVNRLLPRRRRRTRLRLGRAPSRRRRRQRREPRLEDLFRDLLR
jgi:uncharacterized protein DUF937